MEFIGKVYFDDILQDNRDISNLLDNFKLAIKRETSFSSGDNILRESSDLAFDVKGCAYDYLCSKFKESPCDDVRVYFELNVHGEILSFNGLIRLTTISWKPSYRTANIKAIKDNSFSGFIRDFINLEVNLFNTKTKNCEEIAIPVTFIEKPTIPAVYSINIIRAFDVLDVLKFIIEFFTDNKMTVKSNYLTNVKYAVATGYSMHNVKQNLELSYPKLSFEKLFSELRKKEALYIGIEYDIDGTPYLRIEDENYFFSDSELLFSLDKLPLDASVSIDKERTYNAVDIGSNNTTLKDTTVAIVNQIRFKRWNKETYINCGSCGGEKNSTLDLVSDFIIDANLVHEAMKEPLLSNYTNDDKIFLLNYFYDGTKNLLVGNNNRIYNERANNENVLQRCIGISNACLIAGRYVKYGFQATSPISDNITIDGSGNITATNCDFIRILDGSYFGSRVSRLWCQDEIFDNEDTLDVAPDLNQSPGVFDTFSFSKFTCKEYGSYKFHTKSKIKCIENPAVFYLYPIEIRYDIRFVVYQDNTYTTIIDSSPVVHLVNSAPDTTVVSFDFDSPTFVLNVGNVVVVEIDIPNYYVTFSANYYLSALYDSAFELLEDNTTCTTITDNLDLFKPYVLEYSRFLSACDYNKIKANPKGYIDINGNKYYVGEVNYTLQKTDFKLITNKLIC